MKRTRPVLCSGINNLFINVIIFNLNQSGFGSRVQHTYIGCILYADDIILLSPTVSGLQAMLNVCHASSCELRLQFNANKSHCIAFCRTAMCINQPMQLGPDVLMWTQSIKYLGVHVLADRSIGFDTSPTKRSFYVACNSILNHSNNLDELVQLRLQESYTLPISQSAR